MGLKFVLERHRMIDKIDFSTQWIRFQKNLFRSTYGALSMAHERTERTTCRLLESAFWMPQEGINALQEWSHAFKQGRDLWKRCVDDNFESFEKLFNSAAETNAE